MIILGISAFYHDSAATLIKDGEILFAAEEERFSRKKHDKNFPHHAISFCLNESQLSIADIDHIVFYDRPFVKFERILETTLWNTPLGFSQFMEMSNEWLTGAKLNLEATINDELKKIDHNYHPRKNIHFCEHHLSHAASAYYPSPFDKALILCLDGVGEWATTTLWKGNGNKIEALWEIDFPHSLGLLYSAFTYFIGFKVNDGEYKLMGLAPYGQAKYVEKIYQNLIDVKEDGSFRLNMDYFNYTQGMTMTNSKFDHLFGIKPRKENQSIEQIHKDIAKSIQVVLEEIIIKICKNIKNTYQINNLCLAGGVALNCVANGKIIKEQIFDNVWIQPASGDSGGAVGAALDYYFNQQNSNRILSDRFDGMKGTYLGPKFSNAQIEKSLNDYGANFLKLNDEEIIKATAMAIADQKVIGWFSGRMEFGPRSLGSRSILGDPRNKDMQSILNLKIKFRESFRPFAPAVLFEDLKKYFQFNSSSPYMLFTAEVNQNVNMPSITHVDNSARIQTVHQETNKRFHQLISKFKEITNSSVIINTSFNIRGEPIVCTPEDAFKCFMKTNMDVLVIENYILYKENQVTNKSLDYTTDELNKAKKPWIEFDKFENITEKELAKFGYMMAGVIPLIGIYLYPKFWKTEPAYWTLFFSLILILSAFTFPIKIKTFHFYWMCFAKIMSQIKSKILLFLVYFFLLSPYGLIIRLFVKSNAGLKIDKHLASYFKRLNK